MKDLGPLHYFLGISVEPHAIGLFLSQKKYASEVIDRVGMSICKSSAMPVDTKPKLRDLDSPPISDLPLYRSLVSALQYLTFSRPNIAYVVQQVCLIMHDPREFHMVALKQIVIHTGDT